MYVVLNLINFNSFVKLILSWIWHLFETFNYLMVTGDSMIGCEGSILESLSRSQAKMRRGSPLCERMIV